MYEDSRQVGADGWLSDGRRLWFVYLFPLTDCSAFKVGFSCNPLRRIYSFSRRYFEQFDVYRSALLKLDTYEDARLAESTLKAELAQFRSDPPHWVPVEAGGHTEWFSAIYLGQAEERLRSFLREWDGTRTTNAFEFIRGELSRQSPTFEQWAVRQAHYVRDAQCAWRTTLLAGSLATRNSGGGESEPG